jgi:glycosyltransferase involved in cell wall biosynthesis
MINHVIIANDSASINGGAAKVAIVEAKALVGMGLRVTFFAANGPVDKGLVEAGVEVVCLNQADLVDEPNRFAAVSQGFWNIKVAQKLSEIISSADPKKAIIHGHTFSRGLSPSFGRVLTSGRLPHIYTMHEYFLACPNGGFYDYKRNEICTRKPLGVACLKTNCDQRQGVHKLWRVARQAILLSAGRMPRALKDVIYISQTQLNAMHPYLSDQTELHYLSNPNEIDTGSSRVGVESNDIFLYVGRMSPEKGCVDFAIAAKQAGVRAVFLGAGPEEDAIREANPEAEIIGWVSPQDVANWMKRSRALVFPSLWYEGQPLVSMEALSIGLPVIVAEWNAGSEQVVDKESGFIYSQREDLAEMLSLMTPLTAKRLSENAFEQRESYGLSLEGHVNQLMEIYSKVQSRYV